jgi:hypothetical protein
MLGINAPHVPAACGFVDGVCLTKQAGALPRSGLNERVGGSLRRNARYTPQLIGAKVTLTTLRDNRIQDLNLAPSRRQKVRRGFGIAWKRQIVAGIETCSFARSGDDR